MNIIPAPTNGHVASEVVEAREPATVAETQTANGSRPTRRRWQSLALYAAIWIVFITLRNYGGRTPLAHALTAADSRLEQRLFGGELPTETLQRHFSSPLHPRWYDFVATSFEWSFFVVPHILAVLLWRRHPSRFERYLRASVLLLGLGLLIYYLIPSAPPWFLAGRPISRIMASVGRRIFDGLYTGVDRSVGEDNPIAAMPSIHFAVVVLLTTTFWSSRGWPRLLTLCYAGLMGISLVYLGEHFVVDLAAGGAVALYAWWMSAPRPAPITVWRNSDTPQGDETTLPRLVRRSDRPP